MRIWIVTVSEQVPSDSPAERLLRGGTWAHELARRGHQVVWWTDNVDHMRKRLRTSENASVRLSPSLELRMVAGAGYKRSMSLARLRHYRSTSRELGKWMAASTSPDVCLAALPALEWVEATLNVGELRRFPVVVDCRDMWPDLFLDIVPGYLRWPARLALWPLFRLKRRVLRRAFAISGVTTQFVEWGLAAAERQRSGLDFVAHHAYPQLEYDPVTLAQAAESWDTAGLNTDRGLLTLCFFGVLASGFDFEPVMAGLRLLGPRASQVRLVICGDGHNLHQVQRLASGLDNVHFAGHVSGARIRTMMDRSDVALAPYTRTRNFMSNIPGKISEYLSAGLPIVSGVDGAIGEYLESNCCGWLYSDASGFADRVAQLLDQPAMRLAAHHRATAAFDRDFRADKIVAGVERALQLIAESWSARESPGEKRY
jgi:glycosyltransferase involved in cell wall biosynthesis